jgi:hypothetical protein
MRPAPSARRRPSSAASTSYLDQKSALYRGAPSWLRQLLDSPALLKWAAGKTAKTRPDDVGELTVSMLQGEQGRPARDLGEMISWLKQQPHIDAVFSRTRCWPALRAN